MTSWQAMVCAGWERKGYAMEEQGGRGYRRTRLPAASSEKRQRARELRREQTEAERTLWRHLRANALDGLHFRRQQPIAGFIVDFYCHSVRLIVEVDGDVHDAQPAYDAERDAILTGGGYRVLRFSNAQVRTDLNAILTQVTTACRDSL
jgi:very-short-patch-repair endonuclease